jgi:hypothetical protein
MFPVSKYMHDSFFNQTYHYQDRFITDLEDIVSHSKPAGTPIDFSMKFSPDSSVKIQKDHFLFNSNVEVSMNDIDGSLLTDFLLKTVSLDLKVVSDPLYATVNGVVQNFKFYGAQVNKQGKVNVDPREVRKDDSEGFENVKD